MDELRRALREIAAKLPELQRLVDEASGYALLPPELTASHEDLAAIAVEFNNRASELRRLLLSQIQGELPPPDEGEFGPGAFGRGPLFPPPPEPEGGAASGARRTIPPIPRSPGGERLPDEARELARNP